MLFTILAIILFSPVLRMYSLFLINPSAYRDKYFYKLTKDNQELYILGTPHEYLLKQKSYSLLHIDAVIKNLVPDLLLVESRPSELKLDNKADGPWPETLYSHLTACSLGIPVSGVDYWTPEDGRPSSTYSKRDDKITENVINESKGFDKVLIILGSDHVIKGVPRLEKYGYEVRHFSKKEKSKLFILRTEKLEYPKDTEFYLEKRIQREKDLIGSYYNDETWIENANKMINGLELVKNRIKLSRESTS